MKPFCVSICLAVSVIAVNADAHFFGGPMSGTFTVFPLGGGASNYARLNLEGSGFRVVALHSDSGAVDALSACLPCRPGDDLSLAAVFANDDLGEGTATVAGERLRDAYVAGYLQFSAGTVRVPDGGRRTLSLRAPFTVDDGAELQLYADDFGRVTREPDQMWGRGLVSGSGVATINLTRVPAGDGIAYVVDRIKYAFSTPAEEPIPVSRIALLGNPTRDFAATGR